MTQPLQICIDGTSASLGNLFHACNSNLAEPHASSDAADEYLSCSSPVPMAPIAKSSGRIDWEGIYTRIKTGLPEGVEELYRGIKPTLSAIFFKSVGVEFAGDKVHDTFLLLIDAIHKERILQPAALPAYAATIAKRVAARHIDSLVRQRNREPNTPETLARLANSVESAERQLLQRERVKALEEMLMNLTEREREILTRFYVKEENPERICEDMDLSPTQFRLCKSRAKQRLTKLAKRSRFRDDQNASREQTNPS